MLPCGWTSHFSATHKREYFVHTKSGTKSWSRPTSDDTVVQPLDSAFINFLLNALRIETMSDTDWIEETPELPLVRMDSIFVSPEHANDAVSNVLKSLNKDRAAIVTVDALQWHKNKRSTWGKTTIVRESFDSKYGDRALMKIGSAEFPIFWVHRPSLVEQLASFQLEIATEFNLASFAAWIGIDTHKASPHRRFAAQMTHTGRDSADKVEWAEASLYRVFIIRKMYSGAASSLCRKMRHFLAIE